VGLSSKLETHAITSHAHTRAPRPKSESRLAAEKSRQKLLEKLENEGADDLTRALAKCGQADALVCTCCGEKWDIVKRCNRKWCPACQRALATRASLRYTGICESFSWPLFVTFTVKNLPDPSLDFVRALRRSFGKLRRLRWWNKCVTGGVAGIEVTNTGKGWHPHIHALLDCKWLSVTTTPPASHLSREQKKARFTRATKEVQEQWALCTGVKSSVKIKRASARGNGRDRSIASEIIKYSVKGSDLVDIPDDVAPVLRMLDGTRLLTSFGSAYGHLRDWDAPKQISTCSTCGSHGQWTTINSVDGIFRDAARARRR